jgi:hypothetical protein
MTTCISGRHMCLTNSVLSEVANKAQENIGLNCMRNGNMILKSARYNGMVMYNPAAGHVSTHFLHFRCRHLLKSVYNTAKLKQMTMPKD